MNQFESIKEYYGQVLSSKSDLQTSACCAAEALPVHLRAIAKEIHPEVQDKFYGCGAPIPEALEGATVLDLGCGTGRDVYMLSRLVGPSGKVIGLDMTDEQLTVARKHVGYHTEKFGYSEPNVEFTQGYIEDLESAKIPSNSVDVIVSNCVINLSPEKERVFREAFRVLKPGGELYFSDVFCDRRLPAAFRDDQVLLGECLGGAMYIEDFRRWMHQLGCADYRTITSTELSITNPEIKNKVGNAHFFSVTVRAFKLELEDRCEDYGQVAYYKGTLEQSPNAFVLDNHHTFETNRPVLVCSNTARMLQQSRLAPHFRIEGDESTHYGLFDCGPQATPISGDATPGGACC